MSPLDRYTCEQVYHLLDDYVDRELTAAEVERVEQHLAACAECASESRFERTLVEGLRKKLRHIEIPPSVFEKFDTVLEGFGRDGNADVEGGEEP